jgi:hypothetical protein
VGYRHYGDEYRGGVLVIGIALGLAPGLGGGGGAAPISYLLRDDFTDTRAAGAVNGTPATPGPGVRVAVDTDSLMSASGDLLNTGTTTGWNRQTTRYAATTRVAGLLSVHKVRTNSGTGVGSYHGWSRNSTPTGDASFENTGFRFLQNNNLVVAIRTVGATTIIGTILANVFFNLFTLLRASGVYLFYAQSGNNPLLVWSNDLESTATLYPSSIFYSPAHALDTMRSVSSNWLPTPLASDGFGSTFGTTDGLGHAETSGIGSGGGGVAWTQHVGTWTVSAGKAAAATLSGGYAAATVPTSTANVLAECKVTRSAGQGGLILRWTDANNHLWAEHDGTNCYLKQIVAGTPTTLITAAATYSANARLIADLNGTAGRLYWNNVLIGSTSGINAGLTASNHGLRSTDVAGIQLDDFMVYAKGAEGQYSSLNQYTS